MCFLQFNVSIFSDCVLGFRRPSLSATPQRQSTEALLMCCSQCTSSIETVLLAMAGAALHFVLECYMIQSMFIWFCIV